MKRKITAILAADIAGYSRLVSEHDEETLQRLAGYRSTLEEIVAQRGGTIFNAAGASIVAAGDTTFAEFPSALDALRCAVDVQESVRTRNLTYPRNRHMLFRMGISIGEVTEREDGCFGEGVDIAAQLEKTAKPGGICVMRSVYEQVANKQSLPFNDEGPRRLKNVDAPVHVFSVNTAGETTQSTQVRQAPAVSRTMLVGATVLGAVAMVIAAAVIVKQSHGPGAVPVVQAPESPRTASSAQTPINSDPARPPVSTLPPPAPDRDADVSFWNSVRDSGDRTKLQSYLDRFPNGQFAELARLKISELRAQAMRPPNPPKLPINAPIRPDATDIAAVVPPPPPLPPVTAPPPALAPSVPPVSPPVASVPPVITNPIAPPAASVPPVFTTPTVPPVASVPPSGSTPDVGSGAAPPADKTELAKSLQRELKRVGCLEGNADGVWGQDSRTAMRQFVKLAKLSIDGDEPSVAVLDAATAARTRVCPLVCDDDEQVVNGRCVAKPRKARVRQQEVERARPPRVRERAERPDPPAPRSRGICFAPGSRTEIVACN